MKKLLGVALAVAASMLLIRCATPPPRVSGIVDPTEWLDTVAESGLQLRFPEDWSAVSRTGAQPETTVAILVGPSVDLSVYRFVFEQSVDPDAALQIYQEELMSGLESVESRPVPSPVHPTYELLGTRTGRWYLAYIIIAENELWVAESVGSSGDIDAGGPVIRGIVSTIAGYSAGVSERVTGSIRFACSDGSWRWDSDIEDGLSLLGNIGEYAARINIRALASADLIPEGEELPGGLWIGNARYQARQMESERGTAEYALVADDGGYLLEVVFPEDGLPTWASAVHTREEFKRVIERYVELM